MYRELLSATLVDCLAHPRTTDLTEVLRSVHPSDLADTLQTLTAGQVGQIFAEMEEQERAEVFVYFSPEWQNDVSRRGMWQALSSALQSRARLKP